ncbi:MAG: hypothetical protein QM680_07495 [Luteolibacter sp.]
MKNPWIFPAAALAIGAIGGFLSGKNSGSDATKASAEQASLRTRSSVRSASTAEGDSKRARSGSVEDALRSGSTSSRVQALLNFYSGLSTDQLAEEAKKLESLPMGERMMASMLLFGRWGEVDPTAAMAFAKTLGFAGNFVRPAIMQSWASSDPVNAAKYYSENPGQFAAMNGMGGGRNGQNAASIIAAEWAKQDPEAAFAWANSLTQGKGQALNSIVGELAKTDPKKAAEFVAKMDPADQANAYNSIASQWGATNFSEAQNWINTLPADQRAGALAKAIEGLATTNPELAAQQISSLEPGRETDETINATARNWALQDPQAAAAWLMSQESDRAKRNSMDTLIPNWVAQDAAGALDFVNSQPAGDVRDRAVEAYIQSNAAAEPSSQTSLAESITDERDRNRAVGMVTMRWMQTDPTAARAYVEQSTSIPANMKQRILNGGARWGGPGGPGNRD